MKRAVLLLTIFWLLSACAQSRPTATAPITPPAADAATPTLTRIPRPTDTPTAAETDTPTPEVVKGPVIEQIGPQGGTVAGPDEVRVIVPEGAFARPVEIRVAQATAIPEMPDKHGATPAGPAYEVNLLQEAELQAMIELVLPLQRQEGVDESRYTVLRWDGSSWSDIGGWVEGNAIRVQLSDVSLFQPVLGPRTRRPIKFENGGPYDARVSIATYKPWPPGGSWTCRAPGPPLAVERKVCRWLPLGGYSFYIEFAMSGQKWHYVLNWPDGVSETDPLDCSLAQTVHFRTDVLYPTPGAVGAAPRRVIPGPGAATATAQASLTPPTATGTPPTPVSAGATRTPGPRRIHTEGEGLIVTLKPGRPASLPADGKSQTALLVDVAPDAACWGGPDVLSGKIHVMAETTLGTVSWPGTVLTDELPAEIGLTAATVAGQAVITIQGAYCPREEVIVFGVCTDPAAETRRCIVQAILSME